MLKEGHDYAQLENSLWYLSELALRGAEEIDNYRLGKITDFSHLQEFTGILSRYQLKDTDNALTKPNFLYLPLWRAFRNNSCKEIMNYSELALEMRLFRYELEDISSTQKIR